MLLPEPSEPLVVQQAPEQRRDPVAELRDSMASILAAAATTQRAPRRLAAFVATREDADARALRADTSTS